MCCWISGNRKQAKGCCEFIVGENLLYSLTDDNYCVMSDKIIIYTSPQTQYLTTCPTGTTDVVLAESSVNHVPKRTTYRVKISNSKDLEVLSTAAKHGLTRWVGGQKVRIVGVAAKESNEFAATNSHVTMSKSSLLPTVENDSNYSTACSVHCPVESQYASVADWNYSAFSEQQRYHPGLNTASSTVVSASASATFNGTGTSQSMHVMSCIPVQSSMTSTCQSSLISSHCKLVGSFQTTADIGISSTHGRNESSNSLVKPCGSVVLQGLPCNVRYLGTIAVKTQNVTANSVGAQSSSDVTQMSVISAVKTITENLNGSKLSNGKHLNGPAVTCINNNHVWKTDNHSLIQAQKSSAVSARGLKRPYVKDIKTEIVSNKRMAHSVNLSTDYDKHCNFSDATKPGTHRQPLTTNMLNQVAARQVNCTEYTEYSHQSTNHTVKNKQTVEVSNSCRSQQSLSLHQVPQGSGTL